MYLLFRRTRVRRNDKYIEATKKMKNFYDAIKTGQRARRSPENQVPPEGPNKAGDT